MSQTLWKLSVVLSLVLLAPRAALAGEEASPETGPFVRTELPRSLHLVEGLAPQPAPSEGAFRVGRVLASAGGAVVTGALGGVAGFLFAQSCSGGDGCIGDKAYGILGGTALGVAMGTSIGGSLADGQGSFWGALGGTVVGAGVGIAGVVALAEATQDVPGAALYLGLPLITILGAVAGYELTHAWNTSSSAASGVQPLVAVTPTSAALGLGGRF